MTFIEAIAREEGFGIEGSRAQRNNNPGNMNYGPFAQRYGAVKETLPENSSAIPRFAHFPSADVGFQAMRDLLAEHYAGLTVGQALNKWAPPSDGNDTSSYTANVTKWMGITADTVLTPEIVG